MEHSVALHGETEIRVQVNPIQMNRRLASGRLVSERRRLRRRRFHPLQLGTCGAQQCRRRHQGGTTRHEGGIPVPADGHPVAGVVLHPAVLGQGGGQGDGPQRVPQLPLPAVLCRAGKGIQIFNLVSSSKHRSGLIFQDYSTAGLSPTILTFLQHLREFGLVYQVSMFDI